MTLRDQVAAYVATHRLLAPGDRVLVGVSGGVDSMVLLDVLVSLGYEVAVAHVNYGLRGAASDEDERLVREAAARYGVPLHVQHPETRTVARQRGQSLQEAARELRYAFFEAVARAEKIGSVAVAHHRDDQAETLLLNLFRGAGLEGLAGMAPQRPLGPEAAVSLVRPLLGVPRDALEAYARAQGLAWREDASNRDVRYRRVALRTEILPLIAQYFGPAVPERLAHTAELVHAYVTQAIEPAIEALFERAGRATLRGGRLEIAPLEALPDVWRRRLLLEALTRWLPGVPYRASVVAAVDALREAQVGRRVVFPGGTVWREHEALFFTTGAASSSSRQEGGRLRKPGDTLILPEGLFRAERLTAPPEDLGASGRYHEVLDADRVAFPLEVRFWQPGDRLQPLGMTGHQKVSDLLTQAKVPPHERERVRVVCAGDEIVWVVGHRLADPVRVTPATQAYLRLSFVPLPETGDEEEEPAQEGAPAETPTPPPFNPGEE